MRILMVAFAVFYGGIFLYDQIEYHDTMKNLTFDIKHNLTQIEHQISLMAIESEFSNNQMEKRNGKN